MAPRSNPADNQVLDVHGRRVPVTNLSKLLYPAAQFTKAHLINYYVQVSPYLLPHLKNKPVTLKRYPDGVGGQHFYEKDAPGFTPEWVQTFPVPRRAGGPDIRYILINDLPTLVWASNLANIEIHPFQHRVPEIHRPTAVAFDLDPGEGTDILTCARVAFLLKKVLDGFKLRAYPKVSGSKGLQIYVPLNTVTTYSATQSFAKSMAHHLEREHPGLVVSEMAKAARTGKIFIDWSQNSDFKTTVGVYSMRAKRTTPFISMPVSWEELQAALDNQDSGRLSWHPDPAIERLAEIGDLFAPVLKLKQRLPSKFEPEQPARATRTRPRALNAYEAKRDFAQTAEPAPSSTPRRSQQGGRRRFVIQKHAASHLHYDFRLEMHDVLKSWAVPKGVPYTLDENRLAMATEDHPLEYLDFEGVIPKGQYGGGTVMVWDIGTYELIDGNYYKGKLHLFLQGSKLRGEWLLQRDAAKGERGWLMTKIAPAARRPAARKEDSSALTQRTMAQIATDKSAEWQSNRPAAAKVPKRRAKATSTSHTDLSALPATTAKFIPPMQALLSKSLPAGGNWSYEAKFDGYRVLAVKDDDRLRLLSRNANDLTRDFPTIVKALASLAPQTVLDGELVALDESGKPRFDLIQHRSRSKGIMQYQVFDIPIYRSHSLQKAPLTFRREALVEALASISGPVMISPVLDAPPEALINAVRQFGLEGIVAKRDDSLYESGKRTGSWSKYKVNQDQELVIGGYIPAPKRHFDSLLVGYYEGKRLIFAGKVRNGFKAQNAKEEVFARFKGLGVSRCPFDNLPEPANARRGMALTAEAMKLCCWLKPVLVAQVGIREWTDEGHLRHSTFVGLRDDKPASDVVKES